QNSPRIGYVYPAGGRQGSTFQITIGGQFLNGATDFFVSGSGIEAEIIEYNRPMPQNESNMLRDKLRALQDKRAASRRSSSSTNAWTPGDEKSFNDLRDQILKNPPNRQATPA